MLNRITIEGRLVKDPELKTTPQGSSVLTITVAVERDFGKVGEPREADFFDVVCWNQKAEFVSRHFVKGQMIVVDGRMQSRKWKDNQGNNRLNWEITAESTYFAGAAPAQTSDPTYPAPPAAYDDFGGEDEGVPF